MKFSRAFIISAFIGLAVISGLLLQILISLPDVNDLNYYTPSEASVLLAQDGKIFARFHEEENRRVVTLSNMSPYIQKAVVAVEDERFYGHHGIDFYGIARASFKNLLYGRIVEGGSTITQQLARNLFLTRQKTIFRKLAEMMLALQIERRFTKDEIIEYYLNQIYLGHNTYGVEAASDAYFGKHAKDLTLAEASMLMGIIEGPEIYSPYRNFKLAKARQKIVLAKMVDLNLIPLDEAKRAYAEEIKFHPENLKRYGQIAPYFVSYIFGELIKKYGEEAVNKGGLRVYTTLDTNTQAAAEEIVTKFVTEEGKKYNFSQAALLAIDPRNGFIRAMVGGTDFVKSQFNRAVQMKRQPGSAFKPFVYAAAIEQGISPGTVLPDKPTIFNVYPNQWNPEGTWEPKDFDRKYRGNVTMRFALEKSLNIPSVKLLEKVGIESAMSMAQRMGIKSHLEPGLALTLGVSEVTMLEMVSAYGAFANQGTRFEPISIYKILNRDGVVIYNYEPKGEQVLSQNVTAIMVDMMKGVLTRGTGVRGRLDRPAAAKTGTTEEFKDAWIIGFTPQLVTGVWVGNDDNHHMKGVAEVAVCPRIFKEFMNRALVNEPPLDFPPPQGLVTVRLCLSSGFLANKYCPANRVVYAQFFEKDVPLSECYVHPVEEPSSPDDEDNYNTDESEPIP
jgi:penicillin-binding protein 1A